MAEIIVPKAKLKLETRMQNDIDNFMNRSEAEVGLHAERRKYIENYKHCVFRGVGPSYTYNCYGMTFASRRTQINSGEEVDKILRDDDYRRIPETEVLAGDIAVYYSTAKALGAISGDAEHSAFVIGRTKLDDLPIYKIWVVSRWAYCDEVVHLVGDCPYDTGDIRYFRVSR